MKYIIVILILFSFSCRTFKQEVAENNWLYNFISELEQQPVANPPITITAYLFQEDTVYHVSAPCCDQFTTLYDKQGKELCHPDGGITGKGDGKCPSFRTEAKELFIAWTDERNTLK